MSDRERVISDLRKHFGHDVPILDHVPKSDRKTGPTRLEFWAGAVGYQRGMLKTWDGRLLALIVIPAAFAGHLSFWAPKFQTAYDFAEPYIESIEKAVLPLTDNVVAFGDFPDPTRPLELGLGQTIAAIVPEVASANIVGNGDTASKLIAWRIVQPGVSPLDGRGNLFRGSRWAPPGIEVVYVADSPLGAINEVSYYHRRAYFGAAAEGAVRQMALHKIVVSGLVQTVPKAPDERQQDDWALTQKIGKEWFEHARFPILGYPSNFAPNGVNFVLNLRHPQLVAHSADQFPIHIPLA